MNGFPWEAQSPRIASGLVHLDRMDEAYEGLEELRSDRLGLTQLILHDCVMAGFRYQMVHVFDDLPKASRPE